LEAPKIPSFFKSKGPKQFNYRPWFYNADKEDREKRNRMILAGMKENSDSNTDESRWKLHAKWRESHSGLRQRTKSNFRLLLIITLLFLISFYLLK